MQSLELKSQALADNAVFCIVGARPNFMKIAPIMRAFSEQGRHPTALIHTGQHYDKDMKHTFFEQLAIPEPDIDLEVGSGSHAVQTAEVMKRFDVILNHKTPIAVLVVGDVNSTIACSLVASKRMIPVIHVEAGLRSYDRGMPEEINRVLTDQISDILFTTERSALDNLRKEGIDESRVVFVGNVMIDNLRQQIERATPVSDTLRDRPDELQRIKNGFALLTLHRPSNVDSKDVLSALIKVINELSDELPVVFPVHPRTKANIEKAGLDALIRSHNIILLQPLGYLEMLGFMSKAKLVLTDSGGIQEETTALGIPCITLRENTERPITVSEGTNTVVGTDANKIKQVFNDIMHNGGKAGRIPEFWDGQAARRIVETIDQWLAARKAISA